MEPLSRSDRLALIFFFATACLAFLAWALPNMPRWLTIPGAVLSFGLMVYFASPEIRRLRKLIVSNLPTCVPMMILIFLAMVFVPLYIIKPDQIAEGKRQWRESIERLEQIGPLFNYYQEDQFGELNLDSTLEISVINYKSSKIIVPFSLFFDIPSNVYVASIYIPPIDNINVVNYVIEQLANRYSASFDVILKNVHLAESPPGQSNWLSDTTKFSGRIYLYYDNLPSPDDLARWRLMFSQKGANVELRGQQYLQYKQASK
jgi:hypothetical protein